MGVSNENDSVWREDGRRASSRRARGRGARWRRDDDARRARKGEAREEDGGW